MTSCLLLTDGVGDGLCTDGAKWRNRRTDKRGSGVPENGRDTEEMNEYDEDWDMGDR